MEIRGGSVMIGNVRRQNQSKTKTKQNKKPQKEQSKVTDSRPDVALVKSVSKLPLKRKKLSEKMREDV